MSAVTLNAAGMYPTDTRCARSAEGSAGAALSRCGQKTACGDASSQAVVAAPEATASDAEASLYSALASLRRAVSAVADLGQWLDRVGSALSPEAGDTRLGTVDAHGVSKQRGSILIRTQEGDLVRIKYASRSEFRAAYTSDGESAASAQQASVSQRDRLRISVEGNLNADELQAIEDVMQQIDSLAREFFAGDLDAAFAEAADLNFDSAQLAGVAVRLSQRQHVTAHAAHVSLPSVDLPSEPSLSPPADNSDAVAPPAAAATPATESSVADPIVSAPVELEPVASTAVEPETSAATSGATQSIVNYIAKLAVHLRANDHEARLGMSYTAKLQILIASIQAQQSDPATPTAPALAKLEDVAQQAGALQQ